MGTLIIICFTLLALANGALLTWLVLEQASLRARLASGAVVGLALLSWIGFLTALLAGLNWVSIGITAVILIVGLFVLLRFVPLAQVRAALKIGKPSGGDMIYYAAWTALLVWLFSRVVMFYPDGLHTAPANNFGDLPFHFGVITSLAYGENLPPQNPIFAGMKFTYPFLIDFLTAFFIRCGADWRAAFFVENILLALALVCLLEWLTLKIFNNKLAARLAPVLFLFNGGLGFINFFRQLGETSLSTFLARLPQTFTMNADLLWGADKIPLRWGNVFTTLLIPQRSMLFGLPLVALIITLWWLACDETRREESPRHPLAASPRRRYLLAAGLLTGLLPMLHAHGFFSVMIVSVPMVLLFWSWDWLAFFAPVAVLAAPQAWWLSGTQVRNKLFEPHWWWEAGESNPLLFWAVNAGVFIALLLTGLLVKQLTTSRQARFYLPFVVWFIVPNVVLLAPWPWDNIKVLVYWALVSCPFVAAGLAFLFAQRLIAARLAAAALLVVLTLAGALDVWRALSPAENVGLFSKDELEVAALLRAKTAPRAVILHAPIHNSVVALTGRQSVMGYPGHLWTHGIDYGSREQEVRAIYQGSAQAGALLARLNIAYVLIGPVERAQLQPNEDYFNNLYPVVIDHGNYRVYQVKPNAGFNADVR
jgi:hypothetical protein